MGGGGGGAAVIVRAGAAFFAARTRSAGSVRLDFKQPLPPVLLDLGRLLAGFFVHCESSSLASACFVSDRLRLAVP